MYDLINVSICLSDIPTDKRKKADNGKIYTNITVSKKREVDAYGNTHGVFMSQTKDERDAKVDRAWIGNGKGVVFGNSPVTTESVESAPMAEDDDLAF